MTEVGMGRIEQFKPTLLSYAPEDLAEALDSETVKVLEFKHADVTPSGRCLSAWLLGKSSDPTVSAFLAAQLALDQDPAVRVAILCALQSRQDAVAGAEIAHAMKRAPQEALRIAAAHALAPRAATDAASRGALIERLGTATESEEVRCACAEALERAPSTDAYRALGEALGGGYPASVREAAAWALMGQTQYVDPAWVEEWVNYEPAGPVKDALIAVQRKLMDIPPEWPKGGCGGR